MPEMIPIEQLPGGQRGRAERADAVANRRRILETARQLFAARGVANVCMTEIAQAAGLGKGTLYRRFAGKGWLCLALMDEELTGFQNVMLDRMRQMTINGVSHLQQLAHFLEALVYFTGDHMPLLCEIQRDGIRGEEHTAPYSWLHLTVSGLLRAAKERGELSGAREITLLADLLLAPVSAPSLRFMLEQRGFSLDRISAGMRTIVTGLAH